MRRPYEAPAIARQRGGVANKFGGLAAPGTCKDLDGVPVADLAARFGSPLFVYSERVIRRRHAELMRAFSVRYPKVQHAWSYKTNYLRAVCRTFDRLGSWAEVVSAMEYEMARGLGVEPARIVFNGPGKPYAALRRALLEGATVNLDNMDELYDVERVAGEAGRPLPVGLRVNMALGAQQAWDRFGFNLEGGQALQAAQRLVAGGKARLAGLHAHVGTFILDPDVYRQAARKLAAFARVLKDTLGVRPAYLDLGGGFASRNRLKGAYLSTADATPAFDAYAEALAPELLGAFPPEELPLLVLESGRAMIDEAGSLVTTVLATKRLAGGLKGVVLDAGVNLLFTAFWYDHEVLPAVDRGHAQEDHVLYGPLCMQIDVLREQVRLPHLERGDHLVVRPVGAYNNTQWLQFITLRPNVVMIGEGGGVAVVREAETVEHLQRGERIPPWLEG